MFMMQLQVLLLHVFQEILLGPRVANGSIQSYLTLLKGNLQVKQGEWIAQRRVLLSFGILWLQQPFVVFSNSHLRLFI